MGISTKGVLEKSGEQKAVFAHLIRERLGIYRKKGL